MTKQGYGIPPLTLLYYQLVANISNKLPATSVHSSICYQKKAGVAGLQQEGLILGQGARVRVRKVPEVVFSGYHEPDDPAYLRRPYPSLIWITAPDIFVSFAETYDRATG